jgi:hypothetical protein
MCPNSKASLDEANVWRDAFSTPLVHRLNKAAVGAELLSDDIPRLMSLCPFETVSEEKASPFCDPFALEEFQAYEYYEDLLKYYGTGCVIRQKNRFNSHVSVKLWKSSRSRARCRLRE